MNITDKHADFVKNVGQILKNRGFRVKLDLRNEKIGFKIREHTLQRVPFQLVVGERELETQTVAVRKQSGEDLGSMPITAFADYLAAQIAQRSRIALEE